MVIIKHKAQQRSQIFTIVGSAVSICSSELEQCATRGDQIIHRRLNTILIYIWYVSRRAFYYHLYKLGVQNTKMNRCEAFESMIITTEVCKDFYRTVNYFCAQVSYILNITCKSQSYSLAKLLLQQLGRLHSCSIQIKTTYNTTFVLAFSCPFRLTHIHNHMHTIHLQTHMATKGE